MSGLIREKNSPSLLAPAALLTVLVGLGALPVLVFSGGWNTVLAAAGFRQYSSPLKEAPGPHRGQLLPGPGKEVRVREEFLSLAVDLATLTGGEWWDEAHPEVNLDNPLLRSAAKALAPAYLRTGGTEADRLFYQMEPPELHSNPSQVPQGFKSVLSLSRWREILDFSRVTGLKLVFTLNSGPGPRTAEGLWDPTQAASLMEAALREGHEVAVWELGNEVGAHWLFLGPESQFTPREYLRDLEGLKKLRDRYSPGSRILFQGSAFWPVEGETLGPLTGFWPRYISQAAQSADILNWHFYPYQSKRAWVRTSPAEPARFLDPAVWEETSRQAVLVTAWASREAPGKELWLGETGSAQVGGEPGLSDTFLSALWWADHLGRLARSGQQVVVRQTLVGSHYGLLDPGSYQPRPDFWVSWMWKNLMGPLSLDALQLPASPLRIYRHSSVGRRYKEVWLAVNPSERTEAILDWPGGEPRDVWILSQIPNDPKLISVNLSPPPAPDRLEEGLPSALPLKSLRLPPRSLAFVAVPHP